MKYLLLSDPANITITNNAMRDCFAGPVRQKSNRIVRSNNIDKDTLAYNLWEFTKEVLPDNAYEKQVAYLCGTNKKPERGIVRQNN